MRRLDRPRWASARTGPVRRVCRLRARVPFLRCLLCGAPVPFRLPCGAPIHVCLCGARVRPVAQPRHAASTLAAARMLLPELAFRPEPALLPELALRPVQPFPVELQLRVALAACFAAP